MRPDDLCTFDDVATYMPAGQNLDRDVVERLIGAASVAIMRVAEREFATADATVDEGISGGPDEVERDVVERVFIVGPHRYSGEVPVGDMADTPVRVDFLDGDGNAVVEDVDLSTVEVLPRNRRPYDPITALRFPSGSLGSVDRVRVSAEWGYPEVPEDIRQACISQVREWYVRDVQRFTPEFADEGFTAPGRELGLAARDAARAYRYLMVA